MWPSSANWCRRLATSQLRHGGKVVILARNDPCGLPALPTPPSGSQFLSSTRNEEYYAEYDDETRCTRTKE